MMPVTNTQLTTLPNEKTFINMKEKRFITVEELAEWWEIGITTAYNFVRRKGFPANKIGKSWKIRPEELDSWLAKHEKNK